MNAGLEVLFDSTSGEADLPERLASRYGGALHLPGSMVYANFVASIDGIVALHDYPRSSAIISGGRDADRFVVGLLRAAADAVVIGAGTLRAHTGPWTAAASYAALADAFEELRRLEGRADVPRLVVLTASGRLEPKEALRGALVVTTASGARGIGTSLSETEVVDLGDGDELDVRAVMDHVRGLGYRRVLTEGGPGVMADLLEASAIDELFLTAAPVIAGGGTPGERSTLAPNIELLPDRPLAGTLVSLRRDESYVFLRYSLSAGVPRA